MTGKLTPQMGYGIEELECGECSTPYLSMACPECSSEYEVPEVGALILTKSEVETLTSILEQVVSSDSFEAWTVLLKLRGMIGERFFDE